jgi:ribosome-associated protein
MNVDLLLKELNFKAVRSSGPGGQHVNKTASKIELTFDIVTSGALSEFEKKRLANKLGTRISQEGIIRLECSESRSQHRNKAIAIERLITLLKQNLRISKPRKKTKPSKNAIERRLKGKKERALKKINRKPPRFE